MIETNGKQMEVLFLQIEKNGHLDEKKKTGKASYTSVDNYIH